MRPSKTHSVLSFMADQIAFLNQSIYSERIKCLGALSKPHRISSGVVTFPADVNNNNNTKWSPLGLRRLTAPFHDSADRKWMHFEVHYRPKPPSESSPPGSSCLCIAGNALVIIEAKRSVLLWPMRRINGVAIRMNGFYGFPPRQSFLENATTGIHRMRFFYMKYDSYPEGLVWTSLLSEHSDGPCFISNVCFCWTGVCHKRTCCCRQEARPIGRTVRNASTLRPNGTSTTLIPFGPHFSRSGSSQTNDLIAITMWRLLGSIVEQILKLPAQVVFEKSQKEIIHVMWIGFNFEVT